MNNLSMIAAVGNNYELGYKNQLLCHLPVDLKRFKTLTSGHTVLMGDRTWESLPKKPLPNRRNIVITLNQDADYQDCELAFSIDEAMRLVENDEQPFIMGGATNFGCCWMNAAKRGKSASSKPKRCMPVSNLM